MTLSQIKKCVRFCQNVLKVRDWEIEIEYGNIQPEWVTGDDAVGACVTDNNHLVAKIWVSSSAQNPIQTTCHEMLHVMTLGAGEFKLKQSEFISYHIEEMLYGHFLRQKKCTKKR